MADVTNAQIQNVNMYWRWRQDLRQLYSSVFRWNNMPKEIDMLVVERWLMDIGHVAFFKDTELDEFIILPFTYAGKLDVYGNPVDITVYGSNGYHRILKRGEYVPIYDNLLKVTNSRILETYASRMAEIDRVIDVNVSAQKTPVLIEGDSDTIDSVKTAYNQFDQNERVIGYWSFDNWLVGTNLLIEVMGDFWHGSPIRYGTYDSLSAQQKNRIMKDRQKKFVC